MDFTGKVTAVLPVKSGVGKSGRPWMTQAFVAKETTGDYPQEGMFEMYGEDRINHAALQVGDEVELGFDVACNEYNGRYYNKLKVYSIEVKSRASVHNY